MSNLKPTYTKKKAYLQLSHLYKTPKHQRDQNKFNQTNNTNLLKTLNLELKLLDIIGAIEIQNNSIKSTQFGRYLWLSLMKEFYTGMDKVRAIFKDDTKLKNSSKINIMKS